MLPTLHLLHLHLSTSTHAVHVRCRIPSNIRLYLLPALFPLLSSPCSFHPCSFPPALTGTDLRGATVDDEEGGIGDGGGDDAELDGVGLETDNEAEETVEEEDPMGAGGVTNPLLEPQGEKRETRGQKGRKESGQKGRKESGREGGRDEKEREGGMEG